MARYAVCTQPHTFHALLGSPGGPCALGSGDVYAWGVSAILLLFGRHGEPLDAVIQQQWRDSGSNEMLSNGHAGQLNCHCSCIVLSLGDTCTLLLASCYNFAFLVVVGE